MQKLYLDACALNRVTDDQSQPRIRLESQAIEHIFRMMWRGKIHWVASGFIALEIGRNPNRERRRDALALLAFAHEIVSSAAEVFERAATLEAIGYGAFDALHLACAEQAQVAALITTDDRFLRQAARSLGKPTIWVANPVDWLREVRQ